MSALQLAMLLGGGAIVLGLASATLFYQIVIKPRRVAAPSEAPSSAASVTPPLAQNEPNTPSQQPKHQQPTQQCLFVVFDTPSPSINRALGEILSEKKAFYEAELGAFHLPPGLLGYPLVLASATSPGRLPPLHQPGEHAPVQGVSILIRFLNTRKVARNPDDLITLTREVAALGGKILDAKRIPITEKHLASMYQRVD